MRTKTRFLLTLALTVPGLALTGCQPESRPPARVDVPQRPGEGMRYEREEMKPLPGQSGGRPDVASPPFDDVALVTQSPPEQRAYVKAYEDVGRPKLVIAVNRDAAAPADAALPADAKDSNGAHPIGVRSIDTEAIENILTDWFAADGQVDIISPLAQGRGQGDAAARGLGGEVLIQVSGRITEQAGQDLQLRMVAEALNAGDGRSIGRCVVDVPAPLDKPKINRYTRFMARKLMDGMILSWQRMAQDAGKGAAGPGAGPGITAPPAVTEPAGQSSSNPLLRKPVEETPPAVVTPPPAPRIEPKPSVATPPAPPEDVPDAPGTEKASN